MHIVVIPMTGNLNVEKEKNLPIYIYTLVEENFKEFMAEIEDKLIYRREEQRVERFFSKLNF